jgi:hypothetical protein
MGALVGLVLGLVDTAAAARTPTRAERRAITEAWRVELERDWPDYFAGPVVPLRVSTVNSRFAQGYARAFSPDGTPTDPLASLFRRAQGGRWRLLVASTELDWVCSLKKRKAVARDLGAPPGTFRGYCTLYHGPYF